MSNGGRDFKQGSAKVISDILSEEKVKRGMDYLKGEEFKADRERLRRNAANLLNDIRERYRQSKRTPETAAREKELTLRLAEVGTEAAELRLRLSELLEEEEKLRTELDQL